MESDLLDEVVSGCAAFSEKLWWLSFADATLPKGTQFLGAAIVRGETMTAAVVRAHWLQINPGGEVLGVEIPPEVKIESDWIERLLSREEWEKLEISSVK